MASEFKSGNSSKAACIWL